MSHSCSSVRLLAWRGGRCASGRRRTRPRYGESDLLIVRPHSEHLHGLGIVEVLVEKAVLNADAPRIRAGQVAHELLEGRRRLVGVLCEDREQGLSLCLQAGCGKLLSVLLGLLRVDEPPAHQRSSPSSSSIGVAMPSMMDSRMPGIDTRYRVS